MSRSRELAKRRPDEPPTELRERCLVGLRAELRRQRSSNRWAFAVATAASVLVGLNLSLGAAQTTDFGLRRDGNDQPVTRTAAEIRRLLPDMPPQEATRQAILLARARVSSLARTYRAGSPH